MSMFWRRKREREKSLRVVLGTGDPQVLTALESFEVPHEVVAEAITCDGLYRALAKGADLVIADLRSLVPRDLSPEGVEEILRTSGIPVASPDEFVADPHRWQEEALAAKGFVEHLPSRCAVVASYSGGVGKTTIALDTASLFAERTGLPTLVAEFCYGASALRAICGQNLPDIYDCITEGAQPGKWRRRVDVLPMNHALASMLRPEQIAGFLAAERRKHVLTLLDVHWPHALLEAEQINPDLWLVVGTPKPDALHNAILLSGELNSEVRVVINMARGKLALAGVERDLTLPFIASPERYDGRLGNEVLKLIYAHWK